ncbi:fungal-specific transcription factor domain-containing protein [Aspergillus californicus]
MTSALDQYIPSIIKSCTRCRTRKVKCDLQIPRCSACTRQDEACDITDCVAYPYSLIESLHARVQELESKLTTHSNGPSASSGQLDWSADVSREAEEVGVLAIGLPGLYSHNKYVGSAAGSTFARIFFKQVSLGPLPGFNHQTDQPEEFRPGHKAALPSYHIAKFLLSTYISRVHLWWPFLHLSHLRSCFQRIYQKPRECEDFDKFLVFMVLALAHEYFQTGLHFFTRFSEHPRDLRGLQAVILLTIWMTNSSSCSHSNDLWHLTRYAMSIALELGLHRHNSSWNFTADELELRSRTWWAVYNLERSVALITGRVLSVRDQAIDAPFPSPSVLDHLTIDEAAAATLFHSKSTWPFRHMVELRKIGGRILESIYIARRPNGSCSALTFQQLCTISDEIHQNLYQWKHQLDAAGFKPSREYTEMEIEYGMLLLHLNRPSPTFMIPSQQMVIICANASSGALNGWAKIDADHGISASCRCHRQFHDILIAGLVSLYCKWHMSKLGQTSASITEDTISPKICLDLLNKAISHLQNPLLSRFRDLFSALQAKVDSVCTLPTPQFPLVSSSSATTIEPTDMMHGVDHTGFDATMTFPGSDGFEAYLSQVSSIFDDGILDVDDTLSAWYGLVLDEIGGNNGSENRPGARFEF